MMINGEDEFDEHIVAFFLLTNALAELLELLFSILNTSLDINQNN